MSKLLSIVIPTYNRASELNQQLAWLFEEIQGFEQDCEIIVSDNCSTDATPSVIQKWQAIFTHVPFQASRHPQNIFGVPNVAFCLQAAQGKFVWTIADDDPIKPGTLSDVLGLLKHNPDLALLYLNFTAYDIPTKAVVRVPDRPDDRWMDADFAATCANGQAVFEHCMQQSFGAVIFMTATIYRTQWVQESLQRWPESIDNWGGQGFWTGFCATKGRVMVTSDVYVTCKIGVSHWQEEGSGWFKTFYRDVPEVFLMLQERAGYSREFCRKMVVQNYEKTCGFRATDVKTHLRMLTKWPKIAASLLFLLLL
jgi:hypothetical protein